MEIHAWTAIMKAAHMPIFEDQGTTVDCQQKQLHDHVKLILLAKLTLSWLIKVNPNVKHSFWIKPAQSSCLPLKAGLSTGTIHVELI